jgi:O-6-methylguanine DNA methyltransferase
LKSILKGNGPLLILPLQQEVTQFQQRVWEELQLIPYGKQISYQELAKRAGNTKAYRVQGLQWQEPDLYIVPCHRVVLADGNVGGYAYGPEMKRFLLDLEEKNNHI